MTFLSITRQSLRLAIAIASFTFTSLALAAADDYGYEASGNVIGDDVLYRIGGGNAVSMGSAGNMQSIGVGAGWNTNLICGNMSLTTTLQNQLNGATNGFQTIMSSVIQNATSAVASLPALIIQRANPALYNLLTNGVLQARVDFDRSKATCRAMAEKMANIAGNQMGWGQLAEGQAMRDEVAGNGDAVAATAAAEASRGNRGVPWVGGENAGGAGQQPIRVVGDVTRAGYNLLTGRSAKETSSIGTSDCDNGLVCGTWSSPQEAVTFANRVLGEQELQTCEDCNKTATMTGVGLSPLIQEEYEKKLTALKNLVDGNKRPTTENLKEASSDSLPITRGVIEALRNEQDQAVLMRRLASEVSLASILEKALLLMRLLLAGAKEPNVANNDLALEGLHKQNDVLQQEILNLKTELELRRELANNSPQTIIDRAHMRGENSRGVFQGDAQPDRLQQLEKSSGAK
ncbi:integrating conjugative element protein [Pseudomonas luteola]|uniref:Integrating conjugative element protein n=1 Tax=Pseudomonas luteola TaxID=47886 RepID=A0A2X2E704_PSELU|nr:MULTISPECIES: integrating conjugative element protein [Pseudomonas]SPZ02580.1 integrating conjugative element protein [Pseudomonas luteola]